MIFNRKVIQVFCNYILSPCLFNSLFIAANSIHSCKWDSECFKRQWLLSLLERESFLSPSIYVRLTDQWANMAIDCVEEEEEEGWEKMKKDEQRTDTAASALQWTSIHPALKTHTHTLTHFKYNLISLMHTWPSAPQSPFPPYSAVNTPRLICSE